MAAMLVEVAWPGLRSMLLCAMWRPLVGTRLELVKSLRCDVTLAYRQHASSVLPCYVDEHAARYDLNLTWLLLY
jgi:hypothetical protein